MPMRGDVVALLTIDNGESGVDAGKTEAHLLQPVTANHSLQVTDEHCERAAKADESTIHIRCRSCTKPPKTARRH